jgi:folate-binding protein YgfZ
MGADDNDRMQADEKTMDGLDGVTALVDWGVITAAGPDAETFLQGQLTQDMRGLGTGPVRAARLAGYCSAKGRLLSSFIAWRLDEDVIALACSADLLPQTLKRLSMFVLRARCKLADATGELAVHGLVGPSALRVLQGPADEACLRDAWTCTVREGRSTLRLPDAVGVARALQVATRRAAMPSAPSLPHTHWDWLEVRSGVARITAATAEAFVPQMVNLELTGGVNFQKGCYPGQEVVARSQYRGTLKRRMFLARCDGPAPPPGCDVFHSGDADQPAGKVVLSAPAPHGGASALLELKTSLAEAPGALVAAGTALHLDDALPYRLPAEAA